MVYKVQNNTVIDDNKGFIANSISHNAATVNISGGTLALDLSQASYFKVGNFSTNITSITISNTPSSYAILFVLELPYTSSDTISITWPTSFKWPDGVAPILVPTAGKKDVYVFFSTDGGTTWNAFTSGQNI